LTYNQNKLAMALSKNHIDTVKILKSAILQSRYRAGVSTYKTSTVLPAAYKRALPDVETLKKLMD